MGTIKIAFVVAIGLSGKLLAMMDPAGGLPQFPRVDSNEQPSNPPSSEDGFPLDRQYTDAPSSKLLSEDRGASSTNKPGHLNLEEQGLDGPPWSADNTPRASDPLPTSLGDPASALPNQPLNGAASAIGDNFDGFPRSPAFLPSPASASTSHFPGGTSIPHLDRSSSQIEWFRREKERLDGMQRYAFCQEEDADREAIENQEQVRYTTNEQWIMSMEAALLTRAIAQQAIAAGPAAPLAIQGPPGALPGRGVVYFKRGALLFAIGTCGYGFFRTALKPVFYSAKDEVVNDPDERTWNAVVALGLIGSTYTMVAFIPKFCGLLRNGPSWEGVQTVFIGSLIDAGKQMYIHMRLKTQTANFLKLFN
ncbi:MAG: hypothetical protein V4534_06845 [Myxococcota bacterium]